MTDEDRGMVGGMDPGPIADFSRKAIMTLKPFVQYDDGAFSRPIADFSRKAIMTVGTAVPTNRLDMLSHSGLQPKGDYDGPRPFGVHAPVTGPIADFSRKAIMTTALTEEEYLKEFSSHSGLQPKGDYDPKHDGQTNGPQEPVP